MAVREGRYSEDTVVRIVRWMRRVGGSRVKSAQRGP